MLLQDVCNTIRSNEFLQLNVLGHHLLLKQLQFYSKLLLEVHNLTMVVAIDITTVIDLEEMVAVARSLFVAIAIDTFLIYINNILIDLDNIFDKKYY